MELEIKNGIILFDECDAEKILSRKWFVNNRGYAATHTNGRYWVLHRYILNLEHGNKMCVDHLNRIKLDNRRVNLRICTRAENMKNQPLYKSSKLGLKGVDYRHGSRFRARIRVDKKIILLGTYGTPEEAARAYDRAALEYIGPFAYLNFPDRESA